MTEDTLQELRLAIQRLMPNASKAKFFLHDGTEIKLKIPPVLHSHTTHKSDEFQHSEDFRSVSYRNQLYSFTPTQAAIVQQLYAAHLRKIPECSGDALLEGCDSSSNRIVDVFKGHEAWQTLIVPGKSKGTYKLAI